MKVYVAPLVALMLAMTAGAYAQVGPEQDAPMDNPSGQPAASGSAKEVADKPAGGELAGTIALPAKGKYTWWAQAGPGKTIVAPKSFEGEALEWSFAPAPLARIQILNEKTGNVAAVDAAEYAKPGEHKLTDADFKIVRKLDVRVTAKNGKPVSTASVVLKDAKGAVSTRILDASDRGVAHFFDVPFGAASLEVGSSGVKVSQEVTIERERKSSVASAEVVLAGDIPTVEAAAQTADKPAAPRKKPAAGKTAVQYLVSIIVLGGLVYLIYTVLRNKGVTMKGALEKAGLEVDEGTLPPQAAPAPSAPPLDADLVGAAPGAPPASALAPAATVSGPRLVGVSGTYAGAVFLINSPATVIGRDPSCDIALPDDHTASRRHARVVSNGGIVIHDEGSSNGTVVNGEKVAERELKPGDDIQIGSTRFRFEA